MADRDLCTVGNVRELLPLENNATADDPFLQRLVTGWSETVRQYIGDALNVALYTEIQNGTGTGRLIVRHRPIISVTSVSVGSPPATRSPLVYGTDYVWDELGISLLAGQSFPKGVATVQAVYKAGYVAIPADIAGAVAKLAALRYREAPRLGESSKSFAGETISYDLSDIPRDIKLTLNQYRRVAQVSR